MPTHSQPTRVPCTSSQSAGDGAVRSGFGTLWHEEQYLQQLIVEGVGQASGCQAGPVKGVLRRHHLQVATIIALLGARMQELPLPARFRASDGDGRRRNCSRRAVTGSGTGAHLANLHEDLARRFGDLVSSTSTGAPLFRRAWHRHEAMAARLHALLRQWPRSWGAVVAGTRPAEPGEPLTPAPGEPLTHHEASWENEGGKVRPLGDH